MAGALRASDCESKRKVPEKARPQRPRNPGNKSLSISGHDTMLKSSGTKLFQTAARQVPKENLGRTDRKDVGQSGVQRSRPPENGKLVKMEPFMSTFEKLLELNFSNFEKWLQFLDLPLFPGGQLLSTALYKWMWTSKRNPGLN